ncbi:unnamed protein product [Chrysoparadoxa australica]
MTSSQKLGSFLSYLKNSLLHQRQTPVSHKRRSSAGSSDTKDTVASSSDVAPLATVGIRDPSSSLLNQPSHPRLPAGHASATVPLVEKDTDVLLGYPAASIVNYWKRKEKNGRTKEARAHSEEAGHVQYWRYMVDWLTEVGEELRLQPVTIHSAIALTDKLMKSTGYHKSQWKLQAVCCLSVAAKYEEAERNMPMVSELGHAAEIHLTTEMVTMGELDLAKRMGWEVHQVTSMHFLDFYLHEGVTFSDDSCQGRCAVGEKMTRYVKKYVEFFASLCQQEYSFQRELPSVIAAASIMSSRRALCISPLWPPQLVELTGLEEAQVQPCGQGIWELYERMFPDFSATR